MESGPTARIEQSGERQLTARALITGAVLGALLAPANIYAGLKLGWAFNMALTSSLLSYGFWHISTRVTGTRPMLLLENNTNQVVASSSAMIASAGMVAAVPALTLLTGYRWSWGRLTLWTFTVSLLGIACALLTKRHLLSADLPFPSGVATATTLKQMYARGRSAHARLTMLLATGAASALAKVVVDKLALQPLAIPGALALRAGLAPVSLANLTFALDPSAMMIAVGILVGVRAGLSLLLGAVLGWGMLAPLAITRGWVALERVDPARSSFGALVTWLLWPGVALMVAAALTSLAASVVSQLRPRRAATRAVGSHRAARHRALAAVAAVAVLSVALQKVLFEVALHVALLGSALTVLLAVVAARVTAETDVTPIGAMGQLTQLFFGVLAPGEVTANLMAANVTGGAASQCADLMQDLKCGQLLGASGRKLAIAQVCGVAVGSMAGSATYLLLVRDPASMLLTERWPAPAVATWKAAAEVFARGLHAMPEGSSTFMGAALLIGIALALGERLLPGRYARLLPSPASMGLAMVIPASFSLSMCAGALLALATTRAAPHFAERFLLVIAAGAIAGESLTGVSLALYETAFALLTP